MLASSIMRTTLDLDPTVLDELRTRSKRERKSMGQVASELLAPALGKKERAAPPHIDWQTWSAGPPRVDLEDKDAVWRVLDREANAGR
jgi:hypothetical protein